MAGLRERVLEFLRDDYRTHRDQPLLSQLGDYKREEHERAFRVRLKQLMAHGDELEAQRWLVFHGHMAPQPALASKALRQQAEEALHATPDGTAGRRRGNLCERVMECALDVALGRAALGSARERQARRVLAEADYAKQRTPAWPPFSLEGAEYEHVIACLVGAEAEAWLYDAGYPVAEADRRACPREEGDVSDAVVTAPSKPRLKDVPVALVERYYAIVSGALAAPGVPGGLKPAPTEADETPSPSPVGAGFSPPATRGNAPAAPGVAPSSTPNAAADADSLQSQIVQLWHGLMGDPAAYTDVLVPLALDDRTGAGLYLMGPDLLEGDHPLNVWCSARTWEKFRRLGRPAFLFGIVRRSDQPDLGHLLFPLVRERGGASDTRLENMSLEVLPPERSVALAVANALADFRDECATAPQFNTSLAFYRATNLYVPAGCPDRFRALFGEDDF